MWNCSRFFFPPPLRVARYKKTAHSRTATSHTGPSTFASEELIKSLHFRYEELVQSFAHAQQTVEQLDAELTFQKDLHEIVLSSQDAVTTLLLTCLEDIKVKWYLYYIIFYFILLFICKLIISRHQWILFIRMVFFFIILIFVCFWYASFFF